MAEDPKRLVVAVTGPRQTGKPTIIRQALERVRLPSRYVAVDRPGDLLALPSKDDLAWLVRLWGARSPGSREDRAVPLRRVEPHFNRWVASAGTRLQDLPELRDHLASRAEPAPESDGQGVYLVLWFGAKHTKTVPSSGRRPKTPEALRERLVGELAPDQRRKIKVVVVDVSGPRERGA